QTGRGAVRWPQINPSQEAPLKSSQAPAGMRYRCYSDLLRKVRSCSPLPDPANSLQNIASITQELAASVALVKRKSRKPQESWHWHLPRSPCRNSDKWEGRGRLRSRARDVEPRGFPFRLCAPRIRSTPLVGKVTGQGALATLETMPFEYPVST